MISLKIYHLCLLNVPEFTGTVTMQLNFKNINKNKHTYIQESSLTQTDSIKIAWKYHSIRQLKQFNCKKYTKDHKKIKLP